MFRTRHHFLMAVTGLAFLVQAPGAHSRQATDTQPAIIRIYVPAGAKITVDGTPTKQTGTVRLYESPPLRKGQKFVYQFKATWTDQGKEIVREQEAHVQAGVET